MAVNSIDGVKYQVRIRWTLHGQTCYNVLHFISRGSMDLVTVLLQPILACIVDNLLPVLSNEVTLNGATVKNVSGSVAQEAEETLTTDNVGEISGQSLPSTNTAIIALRSAHAGRSGRGRMALLGIDESRQNGSQVDATFLAAAAAFIVCMLDAYHDSDPLATPQFHWAIWSRTDNDFYPVESASPKPIVGSMRSRKIG